MAFQTNFSQGEGLKSYFPDLLYWCSPFFRSSFYDITHLLLLVYPYCNGGTTKEGKASLRPSTSYPLPPCFHFPFPHSPSLSSFSPPSLHLQAAIPLMIIIQHWDPGGPLSSCQPSDSFPRPYHVHQCDRKKNYSKDLKKPSLCCPSACLTTVTQTK